MTKLYIISNKRTEKRNINRKLRAESKWAWVFFSQRKRKPTPGVINDEDNQIQDGMNNNTKKKGNEKNYYNINFIYP